MKCKHCNADIEQDAQFCPFCGTKQVIEQTEAQAEEQSSQEEQFCVHCGKSIEAGSLFCPYCGKPQDVEETKSEEPQPKVEEPEPKQEEPQPEEPQVKEGPKVEETPKEEPKPEKTQQEASQPEKEPAYEYEEEKKSKKWIWILLGVILLGILGGGYYYLSNKDEIPSYVQETDSIAEISDPLPSDVQSVEGVKARLTEILSKALKMYDEDAVNAYFSKEYRELFKNVNEYDNKYVHDEPGFWCGNIWDGGQDGNPTNFTIIKVSSSFNINAYAEVKLSYQVEEYHSDNIVSMELVFEDGNWYIDNIGEYKSSMKEYLSNSNEKKDIIDAYSKILDDFARKGNTSTNGNFYFLHDITGNGIPELWVQVCDDEITSELLIYEFKDGATSKIYQDGVGHIAHHSFVTVNDCVCLAFAHQGSSSIAEYVYKNGKILTKNIYSKEAYDESDSKEPVSRNIETYEITDRENLKYL